MTKATDTAFAQLFARAVAAGMTAGTGAIPTPMIVSEADVITGEPRGEQWYVPEGVCGFAWVSFAGNTAFGRWAKKSGNASAHYPKGLCYWVSQFNQSMERKERFAEAMAKVLRDAGIDAYAGSRMD